MTRPYSILGESINSRKEADGELRGLSAVKREANLEEQMKSWVTSVLRRGRVCTNRKRIMK